MMNPPVQQSGAAMLLWRALPKATRSLAALAVLAASPATHVQAQTSCYYGAFTNGSLIQNIQPILDFEAKAVKPVSIVNYFTAWGATSGSQHFSTAIVNNIRAHGSIPMITWEPWAWSGPTAANYQLQDIINGEHDAYITQWALDAKAWGKPFFLRFMHEMNGNWYPWSENVNGNVAWQYITAWRHVHDIFVDNGVTNATWVWCVNATTWSQSSPLANLYPGDNYVDWVSIDGYNRGTMSGNTWKAFNTLFSPMYAQLNTIAPAKPIMIAECGTVEQGGSKPGWYNDALTYDLKYTFPRIKAFVYFNVDSLGFNNVINTTEASRAAFATGVGLSYYASNIYGNITASPIQPLLNDALATDTMAPFGTIALPLKREVPAGSTVEVRVNAVDKNGISRVEFYVNGALKLNDTAPPYQYFWPVPATVGAGYSVSAKIFDTQGNSAITKAPFRAE